MHSFVRHLRSWVDATVCAALLAATLGTAHAQSGNPLLIGQSAGFTGGQAAYVAGLGLKPRVGLAYLGDVGPANLKAMQDALASHQLTAAAVVPLDRNAKDFAPQVEQLMASKTQEGALPVRDGTLPTS